MKDKKDVIDKINKSKSKNIEDANIIKKDYSKFYLLGLVLVVLLSIAIYYGFNKKTSDSLNDNLQFKNEYESLNNTTGTSGKVNMEISISEDNMIKYSSYDEIFDLLDNGTGVIYFGFPSCPWCRALVPNLLSAASEVGIDTIYYLNNLNDRDTLELDEDGNINVVKDSTDNYKKLVEKLYNYIGEYEGLNDSSIKRLYFPTVIFVKDGKIVDVHIGTFDEQTDPRVPMTDEEKSSLQSTLVEKINKTIICDKSC